MISIPLLLNGHEMQEHASHGQHATQMRSILGCRAYLKITSDTWYYCRQASSAIGNDLHS